LRAPFEIYKATVHQQKMQKMNLLTDKLRQYHPPLVFSNFPKLFHTQKNVIVDLIYEILHVKNGRPIKTRTRLELSFYYILILVFLHRLHYNIVWPKPCVQESHALTRLVSIEYMFLFLKNIFKLFFGFESY
jgi:hypothetical protein